MHIRSWGELATFAEGWGDQALSKLVHAERKIALNVADGSAPTALCFSANYFPGLLQTKGYVAAMCRGRMQQIWEQRNIALRMARQRFMTVSGVVQRFLVNEAVLTYRPNNFSDVMSGQLEYVLDEVKKDMKERRRTLDFRVIPSRCLPRLPADVYQDTFSLYRVGEEVEGFKEPWYRPVAQWDNARRHSSIEVVDHSGIGQLEYSWEQLGSVALSPNDSLDCMHAALRSVRQ